MPLHITLKVRVYFNLQRTQSPGRSEARCTISLMLVSIHLRATMLETLRSPSVSRTILVAQYLLLPSLSVRPRVTILGSLLFFFNLPLFMLRTHAKLDSPSFEAVIILTTWHFLYESFFQSLQRQSIVLAGPHCIFSFLSKVFSHVGNQKMW